MSRLAQLGVFTTVLGGVVLFLGLFPNAVAVAGTPGIGVTQILAMLAGLCLIVLGAYVVAYAMIHRGKPRTLLRDIGVRMGLTGMVFAAAATLADVLGFGSHITTNGPYFGWAQAAGMLFGFVFAAAGVLIYTLSRP